MEIETENGTSGKKEEGLGYGGSLPVQSVQELIHTVCLEIRDTVEMPRDLRDLSPNIPVIDFSLLSSGGEGERRRINPPAKEWGFFQKKRGRRENYFQMLIAKFASTEPIINHEVAEDIVRIIKSAMAEKRKYAMAPNDVQGYGQKFEVSEGQKLDWNNLLSMM
ncbi:Protein SRG1, partial [Ananas comosus]